MRITLILEVDEAEDVDVDHDMGITTEAYERLIDALASAGFGIIEGPHRDDTPTAGKF